jgi:hypothetical protein
MGIEVVGWVQERRREERPAGGKLGFGRRDQEDRKSE